MQGLESGGLDGNVQQPQHLSPLAQRLNAAALRGALKGSSAEAPGMAAGSAAPLPRPRRRATPAQLERINSIASIGRMFRCDILSAHTRKSREHVRVPSSQQTVDKEYRDLRAPLVRPLLASDTIIMPFADPAPAVTGSRMTAT